MLTLLNETAELALDLLEKNGVLFPICRAYDVDRKVLVIGAHDPNKEDDAALTDEDFDRSVVAIRTDLKRRIAAGQIVEFAFCSDKWVRFQGESERRRVLEIEFQNGTRESALYLFPLTVENGKAEITSTYLFAALPEKLL
jgi:hypothetical protein